MAIPGLDDGRYRKVFAPHPSLSVFVSVTSCDAPPPAAPVCASGDDAETAGAPWTHDCAGTVTLTVSPVRVADRTVIAIPYSESVNVRPGSRAPSRPSSAG